MCPMSQYFFFHPTQDIMKSLNLKITFLSFTILVAKAYILLSDDTIKNIPRPGHDFDIKTGEILAPILIPRVSGTDGSATVQRHFVDWFTKYLPKWKIEFQNFSSTTPISAGKEITFVNIIITRDPPWAQQGDVGRLVLAAHYDSKYSPTGFIGATDSAAPCAMIMHAAKTIDEALTQKWTALEAEGFHGLTEDEGIQILFIDGEEAFLSWSDTDSLYGSRMLAEVWDLSPNPAMSVYRNPLGSISLFVLLDLLGSEGTIIPSYFETTHWAYKHLANIETRMHSLGQLRTQSTTVIFPDSEKSDFIPGSTIEDDHVPFMARGVEVLHLIPSHFPHVWHSMEDSGENLDIPTTEDWAKIITIFASEWMELEGHFSKQMHNDWKRSEL